jgi:hypothetical protein
VRAGGGGGGAVRRAAGAFERHVSEAIELNLARAPLYAGVSGGASIPVSRRLVRSERMLLPLARWLDARAAPYHQAGIPVLEDVFVSMAQVPGFAPWVPVQPALTAGPPSARAAGQTIGRAYRTGGFAAAAAAASVELGMLADVHAHWCMYRHMLESALRISTVADRHTARAIELGLSSPLWISKLLLRLHLRGLGEAVRLDVLAYPVQRRGIPILCHDLPPISPEP